MFKVRMANLEQGKSENLRFLVGFGTKAQLLLLHLEAKERQESHGSYNEAWIYGECEEAQRWLKMFGVDVSYDRVKPLVEERCKKYGY